MTFEWLIPVGAGVCRNLAGWLENSFRDGEYTYKWGELLSTVLQTTVLAYAIHYGLDSDLLVSSASAVLAHFGLTALKKAGNQ